MAGNVKLMTSAGGGVVLDTATTTATDVTVKVPVTGVNNGTLACTDANGNLGLGVTPSAWGSAYKVMQIGASASFGSTSGTSFNSMAANTVRDSSDYKYINANYATQYYQLDGTHVWRIASSGAVGGTITWTEAMRIDSSGNLLVGTTSTGNTNKIGIVNTGQTDYGIVIKNSNASPDDAIAFFNNSGTRVGLVSFSTTATTYGTSSDYRLKENIQPMQGALAVVQQLNPVTYTWKADGSDGQGFIAHELQAVVPDCVTGEKDAVDAEGKPVYQGIDTSFLTATLTKAIQELSAKNDALEARIAALEAK